VETRKLKIPPKYTKLLLRILHNGLPVKQNLFHRGLLSDPLCPRCSDAREDISHSFLECTWAKQVWFASPFTFNMDNTHMNFIDWLTHSLTSMDSKNLCHIAAIIYQIWQSRNLLVFQHKHIHVIDSVSKAIDSAEEFLSLNSSISSCSFKQP
jgi:hypothetical protein